MNHERDPVAEARDAYKAHCEDLIRIVAPEADSIDEAIDMAARLVVEHRTMAEWIARHIDNHRTRC